MLAQGAGDSSTPLNTSTTGFYSNASVVVDGDYLVLRYKKNFAFTATSRHTFLQSWKSEAGHAFHNGGFRALRNITVATGAGMANPPLCSTATCNGTMACVEPFFCGNAAPAGPPVLPPTDSSCNTDGYAQNASLSASYNFYYTLDKTAKTISVAVSVPNAARWAAWGIPKSLSSLTMGDAEAVIARFDDPPRMNAFNLGTQRDPTRFTDVSADLALVAGTICLAPSGNRIFKFVRNLSGKANPISAEASTNTGILGVIGRDGPFNFNSDGTAATSLPHGLAADRLATSSVNLASGGVTNVGIPPIRMAHGSLMFIGWGVFLQFGAFMARYGKKLPKVGGVPAWFFIHRLFQPLGYLIALIGFIIAIVFTQQGGGPHFAGVHQALGLTTMILGLVQLAIVPFRPHPPNKEKGETEPTLIRKLWEFKHWYVGRAALILTVVTIFYGLNVIGAGVGLIAAYGAFVGVSVLLYIIFEILRIMDPDKARVCY